MTRQMISEPEVAQAMRDESEAQDAVEKALFDLLRKRLKLYWLRARSSQREVQRAMHHENAFSLPLTKWHRRRTEKLEEKGM